MEERRRVLRQRTLKAGRIVIGPRTSAVECTVRNLSPAGALLLVPSVAAIPDGFELVLEAANVRRACRVIWRGDSRVGVEFV
jgi:hypothetical protein